MKKFFFKIIVLSFLIFNSSFLFSQVNLVPNGSFEIYTSCPNSFGQNYYLNSWQSFRSSPDYFSGCSTYSSGVSVPKNDPGYQQPYEGNSYVGIIGFHSVSESDWEIVGAPLTNSLIIGQKYFFSMMVNLASIDPIWCSAASNGLGVAFSSVPFSTLTPKPLNSNAKVFSSTIIQDTLNWVRVFGSFVSDSSYTYVMIGNFFNTMSTNTVSFFTGLSVYASYYFIDDVRLSTDSFFVNSISEFNTNENILIYPNPFNEIVVVKSHNVKGTIYLYDSNNRQVYNDDDFGTDVLELNFKWLKPGLYYLIIEDRNKYIITKKKIIKL